MDDRPVSSVRLLTATLWVAVILLLLAAWLVNYLFSWQAAQLLGYTACALSAFAAVSHIHCYVIRAVRYVLANIERPWDDGPGGPSMRSV